MERCLASKLLSEVVTLQITERAAWIVRFRRDTRQVNELVRQLLCYSLDESLGELLLVSNRPVTKSSANR
jgi:hypothetical protein